MGKPKTLEEYEKRLDELKKKYGTKKITLPGYGTVEIDNIPQEEMYKLLPSFVKESDEKFVKQVNKMLSKQKRSD